MSRLPDSYPHAVRGEEWDVRQASRVVSGIGSFDRLGRLVAEQGATRTLVLSDSGLDRAGIVGEAVISLRRNGLDVSVHSDVPANPTLGSIDDAARSARDSSADHVVALGGGSVLDASKAVALLAPTGDTATALAAAEDPGGPALPITAVPTTAGTGAETNGFGVIESAARRKVYLGSDRTVPALVVLDPGVTVGLPAAVTAASGFDAVIHGAESLLSRGATATSRAFAAESLRLTTSALTRAVADGTDLEARSRMLTGAHLAGRALTLSGLGVVHGIGHSLTATLGTPHGCALAAVVGPALRLGIDAHPAGYADLARALGLPVGPGSAEAAVQALVDLAAEAGLATDVADLDVPDDVVDALADKTLEDPVTANTPCRPARAQLVGLLRTTG